MLIKLVCGGCGKRRVRGECERVTPSRFEGGGESYLACRACKGEVSGKITGVGWVITVMWMVLCVGAMAWVMVRTYQLHVPWPE